MVAVHQADYWEHSEAAHGRVPEREHQVLLPAQDVHVDHSERPEVAAPDERQQPQGIHRALPAGVRISRSAWNFLDGALLLRVERDAPEAADAPSAGADAATPTWRASQRRAHGR